MKRPPQPGLLLVAAREARWIRRHKAALFLLAGIPCIAFALLAWAFSNAVIRDQRIAIVDMDRSPASMAYVQAISSSPGVRIAERSGDMFEAMRAIRGGGAIAAVYIPENFERDLIGRKRPQIVAFYNRQYFTPGNNAASSISAAIAAAKVSLPSPIASGRASFTPGMLAVEPYVLTNPAMNYAQFLLRAILPTVLHVIAAVAAGFAVGREFSARTSAAWLRTAGGSPLCALIGKLAPLFGVFLLFMAVVAGILHGFFGVPFRGDPVLLAAAVVLLLISYLSLGALLQLLTRNLAMGLSLTGVICSPAFGFAGVGFPILAMNAFSRFWGSLLPLRWYIQILVDQAARGSSPTVSIEPFLALASLTLAYFAIAWLLLRKVANSGVAKSGSAPPPARAEFRAPTIAPGIGETMFAEIRRIVSDKGARGFLILAPLVYALLYPQPYVGQLLRALPVAVVDHDHSEISRRFLLTLNAHEALSVAVRTDDLDEAKQALAERRVFGIVTVPEGTERDILTGDRAHIAAYVDSAYFLIYSRTLQGFSESAGVLNQEIAAHGARADGSRAHIGLVKVSPVDAQSEPLFNPTGGYGSYVVPAAFILILQQTLLMGAASLSGAAFELGGRKLRASRSSWKAICGQALAHLCVVFPAFVLYLGVLPRLYGFSVLGRGWDLALMAIPFILSVSLLAQFVGAWFKRRESAVLLFIAVSLPLFFTVGVAWPPEALPENLRLLSRIFPSTSAIDGLVRINQMGATISEVSFDWINLWILTAVYFVLAVAAGRLANAGEVGDVR
jgi:ABC-2 type transport system permease protein